MKPIFTVAIAGILLSRSVTAQNCTTETLLQKKGVWKESNHFIKEERTAAESALEKKTVAEINQMIKSAYSPMGVEALANGSNDRTLPHMPVRTCIYSIIPLEYYCDGNSIKPVHETSTYFQIGINYFINEIYDSTRGDGMYSEGFHV